jgi:5'-nucleotidase
VTDTLVLGVDLDGVCAGVRGPPSAHRSPGSSAATRPTCRPAVLDQFSEWGLDPDFAEHRTAVTEDRMFRTMAPMPGVSEALWELSDLGVWIRIITHRLCVNWAHETTAADTAAWLDEQRIPYRDLCFIGAKPDVGADIYVEDSPTNVTRAAGRAGTRSSSTSPTTVTCRAHGPTTGQQVVAFVRTRARGPRAPGDAADWSDPAPAPRRRPGGPGAIAGGRGRRRQ